MVKFNNRIIVSACAFVNKNQNCINSEQKIHQFGIYFYNWKIIPFV